MDRIIFMKALIISADNFEDSELLSPYYRLEEAGAEVDVASLKKGTLRGKHGYVVEANLAFPEVQPDNYDLLLLPGGKAPQSIRDNLDAREIVKFFFLRDKPVAAICHGPQILASAGVLEKRHATCYKTVADELRKAGALYEDRDVVVDGNLITSRQPSDLPAFMREIMKKLFQKEDVICR